MAMRISAALISLATPDLPRLCHFYQSLLGIPPQVQLSTLRDPVYVEFQLPGLRLGLYRSHHPDFVARAGAMSLCLQVEDLQGSLSKIQALLEDYRIAVSPIRQDFHGQEVDFGDPEGNRIVLHQPSPAFWQAMDWDP
ncbi:MAG: VOC family protein [Thermostichus sp. DG02_5_bins_236]